MIARGFKSVIWVAAVGGAALGCYMVSLRVATERAELAKVERQILLAKSEIRSLETELGTRGRMTQLEQWNSDVLALSAPTSTQYVRDRVTLAGLERDAPTVGEQAEAVRMAADETGAAAPAPPAQAVPAQKPRVMPAIAPAPVHPAMVHQASYTTGVDPAPAPAAAAAAKKPAAAPAPVHVEAATPAKAIPTARVPAGPKPLVLAAAPKPKPAKLANATAPAPVKAAVPKAAPKGVPSKPAAKPVVPPAKVAAPARPRTATGPVEKGSGRTGK